MPDYRTKTVVIDAEQFDGSIESADLIMRLYLSNVWPDTDALGHFLGRMTINTPEGLATAAPGDWIITLDQGVRYPVKDAVFRATYEPVDNTPLPSVRERLDDVLERQFGRGLS